MQTWAAIVIGFGSALIAAGATPPSPPAVSVSPEEMAVYEAVLESWLGDEPGRQLADTRLSPPPAKSDPEIAACAKGLELSDPEAGARRSLAGARFARRGVELVDGAGWKPVDPGESIARGKSVDEAVEEGFANALMSFSGITFSRDRKEAIVSFSTSCGRLCGSGSTLRMKQIGGRWTVSKRCGGWVS